MLDLDNARREAIAELWRRGELSWKLWEQQQSIYQVLRGFPISVQTVVLLCARQFGKSVLGTLLATEDCQQNPGVVVMIIGPTIKQTRAIVRPRMKLILHDAPRGLVREVKSEDTWYFANGSELKLGGFDTNAAAQRGKTLYRIYIEETCNSEGDDYSEFLREDLGPALTHSKHAQIVHLTTLPKIPDHPFVLETMPEAEMAGALFRFTIHDNRMLTPAKFAQCVKLCGGEHTTAFRREYLCEQVRDYSIILAPEFNEATHVRQSIAIPEYCNFWIGGDTGVVRDFTVFHLCAYDFARAKILFLDERWFRPETGTATWAAECRAMEAGRKVTRHVDATSQLLLDLMKDGFACALPRKDELEATVNQVRIALQTGQVEIDAKCKLLITTLRSGTFNHNRTDLARTTTLGHMDAFMAAAYAIRHANKANPFPPYGDAQPHTHYIDTSGQNHLSPAGKALGSLFKGPR